MQDRLWMCKGRITILGSFLFMLPIGLPWYWGNMAIYTRSYIARYGTTNDGLQTPWIISFYFLFNAVGLFIAGFLSKLIGKRLTLCLGIVLFVGGVFCTHFTLEMSLLMVNLSLGFVAGIGGGIVNGMALQYAVGWAGNNLGFVTSFVQGGFNTGPIFINPFITYLVNPDNLSPDLELGPNNLFSQEEVIDRVPSLFCNFGILCAALQIVGFILVRDCPGKTPDEELAINSNGCNGVSPCSPQHTDTPTTTPTTPTTQSSNGSSKEHPPTGDLKPYQIIKTKTFYTLSFSLMMFDNAMLILANYYKEYGSEWIMDDHFLTFLGTALTTASIFGFPVWGALTDRIGVKPVLVQMFSVCSVLTLLMYFTPRLGRWAYMVNVALSGWFLPPVFSVLIITTCKMFGKTHYSSNLGVVSSLSFLVNFVNPMIFQKILSYGWFYTFLYGSCLTTAALLNIAITLPEI